MTTRKTKKLKSKIEVQSINNPDSKTISPKTISSQQLIAPWFCSFPSKLAYI